VKINRRIKSSKKIRRRGKRKLSSKIKRLRRKERRSKRKN
jgi:hypothetical protein